MIFDFLSLDKKYFLNYSFSDEEDFFVLAFARVNYINISVYISKGKNRRKFVPLTY